MFLGSELEHGNILEEQWRRAKLIVQMCDPLRESQLSASAKSMEFRKVEESVLHVCSSLCHPSGTPWEEAELVGWGEGRTECSRWPVAASSWLLCALRLVPTCSSASFPGQYFSTLESSIVSLFVLLTTAK